MTEKIVDLSDSPRATREQAELLLQWCQEEQPELYARWAALEIADQSLGLVDSEVFRFVIPHLNTDDSSKQTGTVFAMRTEIRRRHGAKV
ncbi:MAG: hypothetical protein IPK59_12990 [Rhodospirillaceae bacterium]|nr:hypothetical protein [Rhodospirillaceae bacterium]